MRSTKRSGRSASSRAWQWKDKGLWLRRAYNEVLRSIPMAGEAEGEEAPEERLVVVYGVTQSGKTALILQLVGVAEEHMKRVYRLIRGGAKQGRSSTSHAFLYRRSEDDCFRVWTQAGVAAERKNPTQLEREEDVSRYVDGLREQMNRGGGQTDVIGLAIPRKYCREDQSGYSLNLLDMPGVGSKDRLEQPQVARLMEQYARLAAVTVVVCPLSQIQSLNDLRIPADENYWWENREKVLIVATYAYSTLEDQEERELWASCKSAEELWGELRDKWERCREIQINEWRWAEQARATDRLEAEWGKLQTRAEALTDECCRHVRKKVQDELWPGIKKCRNWAGERCMELLNGLAQAEADYTARICALGQEREKAVAARTAQLEELRSGLEREGLCLQEALKDLEEVRLREESQTQTAQKLLDNARGIARRHYLLQRDQVIRALRAERDPDERLNLLLLLAGMEQDYNNDINM